MSDDVDDVGLNVVRFPAGRVVPPSMERVCAVEPDVRSVLSVADSLGLELPAAELRERVEEETARHIAEQVLPLARCERRLALDVLAGPVVSGALRACEASSRASRRCVAALRDVEQARQEGGHWLGLLEDRAAVLGVEGGLLLVAARWRCLEAHGVPRAVGLARRGEPWTPRVATDTTAWPAGGTGGVTGGRCPAVRSRCGVWAGQG